MEVLQRRLDSFRHFPRAFRRGADVRAGIHQFADPRRLQDA